MSCGRSAVARTGLAAGIAALLCLGCASGATNRELLKSPNAYERAAAAVRAAEAGDAGAVHTLVELLDDRDGGVRLYAIRALERMTGRTYDYQHYAPEVERDAAVERWREGLRRGEVTLNRNAAPRAQMTGEFTPVSSTGGDGKGAP
jgi:HEAT repeat protein